MFSVIILNDKNYLSLITLAVKPAAEDAFPEYNSYYKYIIIYHNICKYLLNYLKYIQSEKESCEYI